MNKNKNIMEFPLELKSTVFMSGGWFRLKVEREKITGFKIETGRNHRGIEKLSEDRHFNQIAILSARICSSCSVSNQFAYVRAIEELAGIEVSSRAEYIRTIAAEIERIREHFTWLGLVFYHLKRRMLYVFCRKNCNFISEICEKIFGNREQFDVIKIGGVRKDFLNDKEKILKEVAEESAKIIHQIYDIIRKDIQIKTRLKGIGVLSAKDGIDYCAVGPTARASGIDIDVRRDEPYSAYKFVEFEVPVGIEGDVYSRMLVRIAEIKEAVSIIEQCICKISSTSLEISSDVGEIPEGEGIGRHESSGGEVFHYIKSYGGTVPYRHKIRGASYMNMVSNEAIIKGYSIEDAAIILSSIDAYCGCVER